MVALEEPKTGPQQGTKIIFGTVTIIWLLNGCIRICFLLGTRISGKNLILFFLNLGSFITQSNNSSETITRTS